MDFVKDRFGFAGILASPCVKRTNDFDACIASIDKGMKGVSFVHRHVGPFCHQQTLSFKCRILFVQLVNIVLKSHSC